MMTLHYGGRFFVGHFPHDTTIPDFDSLKELLKNGTVADFQHWLSQSGIPSDNYNNYRSSDQICLCAIRANRSDILENFSQHPHFFGIDESIFVSDEFIKNEYLFAWQWAFSIPHPNDVKMTSRNYTNVIRTASSNRQLELLNWIIKNVPDSQSLDRSKQLLEIAMESHSYSALKSVCDEFAPKYIPLTYRNIIKTWEDALHGLNTFLIPDLIELIKIYC